MARRFAERTKTTPESSQAEIRRLLERFGVENVGESSVRGVNRLTGKPAHVWRIEFEWEDFDHDGNRTMNRRVRFEMDHNDGSAQDVRERYRSLVLHIKAQLVAVETGFLEPEHAFLMDTLVPVTDDDGNVTGVRAFEVVGPMLTHAYTTGQPMVPLLPNKP